MKKTTPQNICIIGGGITGLAFAWFLSQKTKDSITIVEKKAQTGGLARAIKTEFGFEIDQFYHFLYNNDSKNTLEFFHALGLFPRVIWNNIKSGVFVKNTLFSVDEISSLMKVKVLTLWDKLRFITAMLYVVFINFKTLDSVPTKKYLLRLFGKNNYKMIWEPLMISKFAEYSKNVPASWIARRIQVTFFSRSWSGKTRYGYIAGTYNPLFRKLQARLFQKKVIFLNDHVLEVRQIKNTVKVVTQNSGVHWYNKVVVATPISVSRAIIMNLDVKKQLRKYKELNAFAILIFLKKAFSEYFWINVNDPEIPFAGIIEMTNLTGTKIFNRLHVLYLVRYLSDKSHFDKEDSLKNMISYLKKINPNFDETNIMKQFSFFASGVAPIPFLHYLNEMPKFSSMQSKIFLLNSSMIYPQDRGVGNSIKLAQRHVDEFIKA